MRTSKCGIGCAGLLVGVSLLAFSLPAGASTVTRPDAYWGGTNTCPTGTCGTQRDVIGDSSFEIYGADVTRTNSDGLEVKIYTNFVQNLPDQFNVGLGALFLTNNTPNWNTAAPNYNSADPNDVATSGDPTHAFDTAQADPTRFQFAAVIPNATNPTSSGTGTLYGLDNTTGVGGRAGDDVVYANVNGVPTTYPYIGNNGYYFREGQAVGVDPDNNGADTQTLSNAVSYSIGTGTWQGTTNTGTLTFDIANAFGTNGFLHDAFTLAWAMTCGNDVIYASAQLDANPATTPIPAALPLFASGLGLMGWLGMKRRKKQTLAGAV